MAETTVTSTESAGGDGRASRAARTRIAVVDALLALNEKGNLRPTAREIAAEAGVSLRSIYVHFDDVESLLVEAAVRHSEYLMSLARPVPTDGPLVRRVAELVANRRTLYEAGSGVRRAALVQEPFSPALQRALEAGRKTARAEIGNVFAAEIAAAGTDGARLRQALALTLGSTSWDVMRRYQGLTADEAEEQLRTMVLALLDGWGGAWEAGSSGPSGSPDT
jgi:TetR/AcrR family transcriptional regulator, regulator of autoinduction and epiphytic fitness